ncbi:TolC family protein, partial [Capnocytophaga cynodegmi]|uniref:TolC family protein n=1 Tax=Capnocytophaga cynodegmi TaxID=28189 RepID=UPI001BB3A7BE
SQYRTNFYQQVGVSINIPIFNKGNSRMQVIQSKINEEIAKNDLEIKKQELLQSIQKIYFDIDAHYQSYISAQETEKSTKLALDFAEKSYEAGINSIYDLNNARNSYTKAQSSVIQSKYNYIFSRKILEVYMKQ